MKAKRVAARIENKFRERKKVDNQVSSRSEAIVKIIYRRFQPLTRGENGATMIEYALLASLVSISAIVALRVLGPTLLGLYNAVATTVTGA